MVLRETVCFAFLRVLTRGKPKLTSFLSDHTYTLSVLYYLDFHIAGTNKQRRRASNDCAIVSWSGYIWVWSGARDQESTNHRAHFVEWKSSYMTTRLIFLDIAADDNLFGDVSCCKLLYTELSCDYISLTVVVLYKNTFGQTRQWSAVD